MRIVDLYMVREGQYQNETSSELSREASGE